MIEVYYAEDDEIIGKSAKIILKATKLHCYCLRVNSLYRSIVRGIVFELEFVFYMGRSEIKICFFF